MKITMDGKYAYRKDPYIQVRILCVDRPRQNQTVISLSVDGYLTIHYPDGTLDKDKHHDYDLVPLQEGLPDLWVVLGKNGGSCSTRNKAEAERWLASLFHQDSKLVRYIPAPDQDHV